MARIDHHGRKPIDGFARDADTLYLGAPPSAAMIAYAVAYALLVLVFAMRAFNRRDL